MTDLLIRNIAPDLKQRLADSAHRNRRSLSQEAASLMRLALDREMESGIRAGDHLLSLIGDVEFTREEIAEIERFRSNGSGLPPDFD